MKSFYNSRVGIYLIFSAIYLLFWKISGFELTLIVLGSTILGELHFQNRGDKHS